MLMYLVLGCLMDAMAMIILTVPIIFPVINALGFDPIWFGVIIVMTVELGLIHPPVGMNVFVIKTVVKDVSFSTIFIRRAAVRGDRYHPPGDPDRFSDPGGLAARPDVGSSRRSNDEIAGGACHRHGHYGRHRRGPLRPVDHATGINHQHGCDRVDARPI